MVAAVRVSEPELLAIFSGMMLQAPAAPALPMPLLTMPAATPAQQVPWPPPVLSSLGLLSFEP